MSKKELAKRYILFIISLFVAAMGVAITKRGELGVSPISSVANVLSIKYINLSLGTWLIIWNCILILGQILMLGKKFQMIQLLQIPLSFLFGYFTDFGMWCVSILPADNYIFRMILVICGIMVLGLGVSLSVTANVIMNSGEAFVKVLSDKTDKDFGSIKIGFDILCVIVSVLLSLLFFHGKIVGTREGTIISAVFTGAAVKFFSHILKKPLELILKK
ncbi:MAG: YitT family protein [Lachnospiraceae bacterium]|nr:YitT family protein [Lachnospiraceae bacterium]